MPHSLSNPSIERSEELRHLLNKAAHSYYVLDAPIIEDAKYAKLYDERSRKKSNIKSEKIDKSNKYVFAR